MVIRRAARSDLPELSSVCGRTFIETYEGKGAGRPKGMAYEYVREKFNEDAVSRELESPAAEIWVAVQPGLVGYFKIIREPPPAFVPERNLMNLERIYVLGVSHGQQIGKTLLAKAEERAAALGFSGLWLGVWEENLAAIQFYLRKGFTRAGSHGWEYFFQGSRYEDVDDVMTKVILKRGE